MGSENFNEPLMYIDQPVIQKPKAYMQVHYRDEKKLELEKENELSVPVNQKEQRPNKNEGESFRSLPVNEKINYLMNIPTEVPKIKCEVLTGNEKHRGILIEENDDEVVLRVFGRENKAIEKNKIENINLIGF